MPELERLTVGVELDKSKLKSDVKEVKSEISQLGKEEAVIELGLDTKNVLSQLRDIRNKLSEEIRASVNGSSSASATQVNNNVNQLNAVNKAISQIKSSSDLTGDKLKSILESSGFNLSEETISRMEDGSDISSEDIRAELKILQQTITDWNNTVWAISRAKEGSDEYKDLENKLEDIRSKLEEMGVTVKGRASLSYANELAKAVGNAANNAPTTVENSVKEVAKGVVGVRALYTLVRKIVSKNEKLTTAVANLLTSLADVLQPVLDYLALILNSMASAIKEVFNVEKDNKKANETIAKSLGSFDEINNLSTTSSSTTVADNEGWVKDLVKMISYIFQTIIDLLMVVSGVAAGIITYVTVGFTAVSSAAISIFTGVLSGIVTYIGNLFVELWSVIKSIGSMIYNTLIKPIAVFIDTFKSGMEEGQNFFLNILESLWAMIKSSAVGLFTGLWDVLKNIISLIINPIKKAVVSCWNTIKTVFTWFKEKVLMPVIEWAKNAISNVVRNLSLIVDAFKSLINGILALINTVIGVINKIPGVNIKKINYLANGGIATSPTLAMVGEYSGASSNPEVIAPLSKLEGMLQTDETNSLLSVLIDKVDNIDFNPYISVKDVGSASVKYINSQNRIYGSSIV